MFKRMKFSVTKALVSLGVGLFLIGPSRAEFSETLTIDSIITDGTVNTMVQAGTRVYFGGSFTQVGTFTGGGVPVDNVLGTKDAVFPQVEGTVKTVASDGSGGWFIGGDFDAVGNTPRNNLAHILSNGTLDSLWDPNADGVVNALAVSGTKVYVGGSFRNIGGTRRWYIGAVSASGTGALDTTWMPPDPTGEIKTVAVADGKVYVGGVFSALGGTSRRSVAALDAGGTGAVDPLWDPNANLSVFTLAVSGSKVYLGGVFTTVGGTTRNHVAAVNKDGVGSLDPLWNPAMNSTVYAIAVSGGKVYVGGTFTLVGNTPKKYLAAVDAAGAGALDTVWTPTPNDHVFSLAVSGTKLYIGGRFVSVGGSTRNRVAAVNLTGTGELDSQWNPRASDDVVTLAVGGGKIYVGGTFRSLGALPRNNVAAVEVETGALDTQWNPNVNSSVSALAVSGTRVYLGGGFNQVGGTARTYVAAVDATGAGALDTQWDPSANAAVNDLTVSGNKVYLGGFFTSIKGTPRNYLAAVDAGGTGSLDTLWDPNPNSNIATLAVSGNKIYVGGSFTSVKGTPRNRLAAVSLEGTGALDTSWNPNSDASLAFLTVSGSTVYLAGYFTTIGGTPRNTLAAVNSTTGALYPWAPAVDKRVYAIAVSGSKVYLGGEFTTVGGTARPFLAAVDAGGVGALDTQWDPSAATGADDIHCLSVQDTRMFIGGKKTVGWFIDSPLNPPSAPASGAITSVSATGIQAQWVAATGATTYTLAAALNAALPPVSPISKTGIAGLTDTVTGLTPNTVYYLSVNATNNAGSSAYTALGSTVTLSAVPAGFQASGITATQTILSWTANGNPNNTTYLLQQSSDNGLTYATVYTGTNLTSTRTDLVPGTTYLFRVLSRNAAGLFSAPTGPVSVTPPPPAPASGHITGVTANTASAQWTAATGATTYTLAASLNAALPPGSPISKTGIAGLTDTVTGLTANTRYYVSVSACNPGACSAYTALGSTVTPSASPTHLQALSRTLTTITLSWTSAGNAAGTVYVLQQSNDGGATFFDAANTTATQATVDQLDPGETYHFRVKAVAIAGGTSSFSSEIASATGSVAVDLSRMRAFPNPTAGSAVIENLPDGAAVTIYTLAGEQLRTLPSASDGRTTWDGKNESGEPVASGIYQAVASGAGTKTIRIAVQR